MKPKKLHTAEYCCPECDLNYNLGAQERLQCDDCGRALLAGSLEDFDDAEEEGSGEG